MSELFWFWMFLIVLVVCCSVEHLWKDWLEHIAYMKELENDSHTNRRN